MRRARHPMRPGSKNPSCSNLRGDTYRVLRYPKPGSTQLLAQDPPDPPPQMLAHRVPAHPREGRDLVEPDPRRDVEVAQGPGEAEQLALPRRQVFRHSRGRSTGGSPALQLEGNVEACEEAEDRPLRFLIGEEREDGTIPLHDRGRDGRDAGPQLLDELFQDPRGRLPEERDVGAAPGSDLHDLEVPQAVPAAERGPLPGDAVEGPWAARPRDPREEHLFPRLERID